MIPKQMIDLGPERSLIFEGHHIKSKPFTNKNKIIWGPGINIYIYLFIYLFFIYNIYIYICNRYRAKVAKKIEPMVGRWLILVVHPILKDTGIIPWAYASNILYNLCRIAS